MNQTVSRSRPVSSIIRALTFCILVSAAGSGRAADETNAPPKPHWESVATADMTLTSGNSKSFLGTLGFNSTKKWTEDEVLLGGSAGYGETTSDPGNQKTETVNFYKGFGQYNHLFTPRLYSGLRLEGLHDNIADIKYRFTVSPMVGYYFIKETNTFLSGEVGPSYVNQKLGDESESYAALRVGERFEYTFKTGSKIFQNLEWLTQVDKTENWILNATLGVSAPISKFVDVRLVGQDSYNNQPAAGRLKNDLKLLAGIGYKF
jgi:putative salt-induced outer membrane protein YdiY